jgi:hypothetical protein
LPPHLPHPCANRRIVNKLTREDVLDKVVQENGSRGSDA